MLWETPSIEGSWETFQSFPRGAMAVVLLWALWRIWTFNIAPSLNSKLPENLPYTVPFIGHLVGMSQNSNAMFTAGRQYFGNTKEVFTITVLGQEYYIVTRPSNILEVFRETNKLDYDAIAKDYMESAGMTVANNDRLFDRKDASKHAIDRLHDNVKLQLHPGEKLDMLQKRILQNLDRSLQFNKLPSPAILSSTEEAKTMSLWKWCSHVFVEATTTSFYGKSIYAVWPDVVDDTLDFDAEAWKLDSGYPRFAARRMYSLKEKSQKAFADYAAQPSEKRADACWYMRGLDEAVTGTEVADQAQRSLLFWFMNRVINSNAFKHCFWCLAYLLHDGTLQARLTDEVRPAFTPGGDLDVSYLTNDCPLLESFCDEVLRMTVAPIGARRVVQQCEIGGKTLKPGRMVIMPYRQNHFDPYIFGDNSSEFDAYRFIKVKNLRRNPAWRPFGGGTSYCPGRYITRREVYMFLALTLNRFHLTLEPSRNGLKQRFPAIDESIPAAGVLPPVHGHDVLVRVHPRKQ
ncbi:cytochrome P450 [Annulohypoxylon nitens]|nr:cytochrome P450 [Annulohypoxylon nitens]